MSIHHVLRKVVAQPDGAFGMPEADFSKWPKPEDIANAIVFLCSDEAKVIHGAAVPVFEG